MFYPNGNCFIVDPMDLQSQIMLRHDKQNMILIREYVGDDPQRFANLMKLFLSDQYRIQQRTSWAVMHCVTRQPTLITPYLEKRINLLDKPVHDAVKRNITRILRDIDIPKAFHGQENGNASRRDREWR